MEHKSAEAELLGVMQTEWLLSTSKHPWKATNPHSLSPLAFSHSRWPRLHNLKLYLLSLGVTSWLFPRLLGESHIFHCLLPISCECKWCIQVSSKGKYKRKNTFLNNTLCLYPSTFCQAAEMGPLAGWLSTDRDTVWFEGEAPFSGTMEDTQG